MTTIRKIIQRDIGEKVEGVVKVFDRSALATEIREYVVTDKIEDELKRIFDTFTHVSETIRRGGASRDVVGIWISGFFGSGTFVNLKSFEKLRTEILLKRNPLIVMLDLGFGILDDATVETTAIVLKGGTP